MRPNPPTPAPTDADYSMGSEILRREGQEVAPTSTPEVEFALVLSRMIDSVSQDPQHLRQTVYELARRKLQEQLTGESVADMRSVANALETAIQGVEAFSRREDPALRAFRALGSHRFPLVRVDCGSHRARSASKSMSLPEIERGRPQGPGRLVSGNGG